MFSEEKRWREIFKKGGSSGLPFEPTQAQRGRSEEERWREIFNPNELLMVGGTPTGGRLSVAGEDLRGIVRKRPKFWEKAWGHTEAGLSFFPRLWGNLAEGGAQASDITRAWRAEGPTIGEVATRRMQPGWKRMVAGGVLDIGLDPTTWVGIGAAKSVAGAGKTLAKEVGAASKVAREAVSGVKVGSGVSMKALSAAEPVAQAAAKTRELPMELIEKSLGTADDYDWLIDLSRKAIDEARVVPRTGVYAGFGKRQVELVSPEKLRKAKLAITEPVLGAIQKRPWLGAPLRMHSPSYIAEATGLGEAGARALTQTRRNLVHGMAAAESNVKRIRDMLMKVEGMTAEEAKAIPLIHRWSDKEQLVADLAANRNLLEKTRKPLNRARLEATITEHERLLANPLESLLPNYSPEKLGKLKTFATEKLPKIYEHMYLAEREPEALEAAIRAWKPTVKGQELSAVLPELKTQVREQLLANRPGYRTGYLPGVSTISSRVRGPQLGPAERFSDFRKSFSHPFDRAIAAKAARDYLETVGPQLSDAARSNLTAIVKTWDVEQDAVQALAGRTLNSVLTKLHKEAFADLRRFTLPAKAAKGKAGWTEAPWAELKGQWIPDEVRDALGRILRPKEVGVFKEKETIQLVKHWQSAQQWMRGMFTGFPVTAGRWLTLNTVGLAWNGLLGGMKTEDVGHGIAVLLGRLPTELVRPGLASLKLIPKHREAVEKILDKGIDTLRHGKQDYRQVAAMAEKHGILRSFGAEENMLRRLKQRGPGHYLNVVNPNSPLFQAAFLANEMEDEAFKAGLMVRKMLEGHPAEEAANITHRFFPDYGELTPFEKHLRANYIPFMTWISRNFRIQLENTLKSPGKAGGFVKGKEAAEYGGQPYPQTLKPDWITEMQGVRIPKKGQPEYFMPRLPVADLPQYLDPQNWVQALNPFIVMMAEYAFHRDLFTGKPITSVKDLGKQALMKLPVTSLGGRIIQRPTGEQGKYLFGQMTGLRKYSVDLTKMANVEKRRQQRALTARERELIKRGKLRKTKRQRAYPLQQRRNVLQYIPEEMLPTIEDSEE